MNHKNIEHFVAFVEYVCMSYLSDSQLTEEHKLLFAKLGYSGSLFSCISFQEFVTLYNSYKTSKVCFTIVSNLSLHLQFIFTDIFKCINSER